MPTPESRSFAYTSLVKHLIFTKSVILSFRRCEHLPDTTMDKKSDKTKVLYPRMPPSWISVGLRFRYKCFHRLTNISSKIIQSFRNTNLLIPHIQRCFTGKIPRNIPGIGITGNVRNNKNHTKTNKIIQNHNLCGITSCSFLACKGVLLVNRKIGTYLECSPIEHDDLVIFPELPLISGNSNICYVNGAIPDGSHGHRILGKTEMALQYRANGQQFAS